MQRLITLAVFIISMGITVSSSAEDLDVLDEKRIKGWRLSHVQSYPGVLNCQAYKCHRKDCKQSGRHSGVHLWRDKGQSAIEPSFAAYFTAKGADNAYIEVGGERYSLKRSEVVTHLLIPETRKYNAPIFDAIRQNQGKKITVAADQGKVTFKLRDIDDVLSYFEEKCGKK